MRTLVLAGLMAAAAPVATAQNVYVTADRLLDVSTGRMIQNPAIIIQDGVITAVGSRDRLQVPSAAVVHELPGVTLLPGLIDMHTHLDSDPTMGGFTGIGLPDAYAAVISVPAARATLDAGFTTVRNVGSGNWDDIALKAAIEMGKVPGPRIVPAGHSFGATGGHCDITGLSPSFNMASPYNADSPDEGRKRVREIRKYGAEVIKICATGGVFSHNTEPGQQQLTLTEMKAIAEEAHMWGLKVAAHAHGASGIRDAALAGIDTIEHASLIDDEGLKLARETGAFLSMDIYNTEYTQSEGPKRGELEEFLQKDRDIAEIQRENFRKAVKMGIRLTMGTDTGVHRHADAPKQLAVMVRYGMTPMQAIQSATWIGAQALGLEAEIGQITPGYSADIIAVQADPVADVRALESVGFVMKQGVVY